MSDASAIAGASWMAGDPDLREHWRGLAEGVLRYPKCDECGKSMWPPRPVCPHCRGSAISWHRMPDSGELFTWTVVARTSLREFAERVPYATGVISIPQVGIRIMGYIDHDPDQLRAGTPLTWRVTFNPDGEPRVHWRVWAGETPDGL